MKPTLAILFKTATPQSPLMITLICSTFSYFIALAKSDVIKIAAPVFPSTEILKKQSENVKTNFVRTLENSKRFTVTK